MRDKRDTAISDAISAEYMIALIGDHEPVSAETLAHLLSAQWQHGLSDTQKLARTHKLLRHLLDIGRIRKKGSRRYPLWGMV